MYDPQPILIILHLMNTVKNFRCYPFVVKLDRCVGIKYVFRRFKSEYAQHDYRNK